MAIMDVFSKEDRAEITVSQLYHLLKEAGRADLFRNGVVNKIPYSHILAVLDGYDGKDIKNLDELDVNAQVVNEEEKVETLGQT